VRTLITGGAGFVGSHVCETLLAAGHEVHVLDDLSTGRRENVPDGVGLTVADLRDAEAVDAVFARFRPEVVSHQGAQTSVSVSTREPLRDASVNVLGTLHVLESCVRHGARRVVFASTGGAIYGEVAEGQRARVGWPNKPISPYACSKLAGEAYLGCYRAMHGLESTILRYANVYGPRQDPHGEAGVVAIFHQRLVSGQPIQVNARRAKGDEGCVRDYVFVRDVAEANRMAVEGRIAEPIVNVCTGVETTTRELGEAIARALGVHAELVPGDRRAGDLERSVLELEGSPIAAPTSLEEGIRRTAEFFRGRA
jgi:UDP-glucose 4-epimerase